MKRLPVLLLIIILSAGISTAGNTKYIAVVESDVDEASGASEKISRADVRLVTAELRREAVKNLPPKKYIIMTAETVIAQGGAVLEDCADENCVISLGSKIGAEFIVRGTVSKLESKFTLQVEMYETNDGTLVASCDPVRSESIGELIEMAGAACANMFKTWLASQNTSADPVSKKASKISAGGGAFLASDLGGGLEYGNGEQVRTPYYGGGAYLFIDATYAEIFAGYSMGGGYWKSADAANSDRLPYMLRSYINAGIFAKYPIGGGNVKFFPLLGIDCEASVSGERVYDNGDKFATEESTSALWFKAGGGVDFGLGSNAYLRLELLYGVRTANDFENVWKDAETGSAGLTVNAKTGHGGSVKAGAGFRF